ncbi:MAG: hypothetical protein IT373_25145 [Polyangiaceae bacterium]|nr:hypothetical protein [Polyangiaceae bacterium]
MARTTHGLVTSGVVVALGLGMGCSKSPADRARELTDPVREAMAEPTGEVNAASVPAVLGAMHTEGSARTAFSFVPGFQAPPSQPQGGAGGLSCIDTDGSGDDATITLDMGCLSQGQVSGQIVYQVEIDDGHVYTYYEYSGVCVASDGLCLEGAGATDIGGHIPFSYDITLAGDLTVASSDGQSWELDYGYQMSIGTSGTSVRFVVFVGDASYVVDASLSASGTGTLTITGANGSFTCSYAGDGATGSCSGSGSFEW